MTSCEVTKTHTPSKLLSGGGDGICSAKRRHQLNPPQRVPVPSCRRFATHWEARDAAVKQKLEKAIRELESPKKPPRVCIPRGLRRSISMSEIITPRKQQPTKMLRLDENQQATHQVTRRKNEEDEAGRRVYEQLLLNAWRRRRREVKTLFESCQNLQAEVEQLKLQKDVLQKLRESEGRRRSEAANEGVLLRERIEKQEEEIEKLYEEREELVKNVEGLEDGMEDLKTQIENVRNEWLASKSEIKALEQQLVKERGKIRRLANDKHDLQEKIKSYELSMCKKTEELAQVENALRDAEANIQNVLIISANREEENELLTLQLQDEKQTNARLKKELEGNRSNMKNLENRISELRGMLCEVTEAGKKLKRENEELLKGLEEAKVIVEEIKSRPWYKNAGELAKGSLLALQYAAFLMLPALPQHLVNKK